MTTTGITLNEALHAGSFMVSEAPGRLSRQEVVLAANETVVTGQILGVGTKGDGTFAAAAGVAGSGNTGNGTMGTPATATGAQAGTYTVEYVSATRFNVYDPNGKLVGEGVNGTAFAGGQVAFTMTAGGTAFVANDSFTIAVTETDPSDAGDYEPLNLSATDGTQNAVGISWENYSTVTSDAVMNITIIARNAEVRGNNLTYPTGATTTQIAAINAQLAALGIIVR
jgi:hypothetical protein